MTKSADRVDGQSGDGFWPAAEKRRGAGRKLLGMAGLACAATLGWNARAQGQQVIISEFLASNATVNTDEDNEYSDWVEIANISNAPVNMDGWYVSDSASNRTKWRIPAITLAPGEHRLIWASDKNRSNPNGPLHTNFKLSADGEYLGLTRPDGVTVEHQYAPTFPAQSTDVSYGVSTTASSAELIAGNAACRASVPTSGTLGTTWTARTYSVPAQWLSGTVGVGYERATGYAPYIGTNVNSAMYNVNTSCYIRVPFTLTQVPALDRLTLKMRYDDGFVAYLNGARVASANAPTTPAWNSAATQGHDDGLAVIYQDFDITSSAAQLVTGSNVLAIHGLNLTSTNSDFLISPMLVASVTGSYNPAVRQFYSAPTPGVSNSSTGADLGPSITEQAFSPALPGDADPIIVTARVSANTAAVASVSLAYRANYGVQANLQMFDDGAHGDGAAGDGVYGATIPASASTPGQMVRWAISATDSAAHTSRLPRNAQSTQSAQYLGTLIADPGATSGLPMLWWWVQDTAAAATETGTRCSLYYGGRFYDNVFVRLRGQSSAGWPKPHYKLDFNTGDHFVHDPDAGAVEEFNLQSTYSDKSYLRQMLGWETYKNAGAPGCEAFMLRVQQNGAFHSLATFVEQVDEDMLTRNGMDNTGALYKMYNECTSATVDVEKKTRETEDNSDLAALVTGIQAPTGAGLTNYMFDNVDIAATISYIAATTIMHDNDHVGKNYYVYRDSEGSGEWTMLPWDKDLTFGRNYAPSGGGVLSDTIWANTDPMSHPLFGDQGHPKVDGPWNRFIDAMHREPTIRQMYARRLRTLMDTLLQAPGTPNQNLLFENRLNALMALCGPDAALDRARWGNPYGASQDMASAVAILKTQYLTARRQHLFVTHTGAGGVIPAAQSTNPTIGFGAIERSPASGDQDEEYIELTNAMSEAVDISGWTLEGDVTHTFKPGTVIPAGGRMFASPDVRTFRARSSGPRGGQGLFVQGNYRGHLAEPAQTLMLKDAAGRIVAMINGCSADFNSDGTVDFFDYLDFVAAFSGSAAEADFNADSVIDFFDYLDFVAAFSAGC